MERKKAKLLLVQQGQPPLHVGCDISCSARLLHACTWPESSHHASCASVPQTTHVRRLTPADRSFGSPPTVVMQPPIGIIQPWDVIKQLTLRPKPGKPKDNTATPILYMPGRIKKRALHAITMCQSHQITAPQPATDCSVHLSCSSSTQGFSTPRTGWS